MDRELSLHERWELDEQLAEQNGGIWDVDPANKPRWVDDDLGEIYGPGAKQPEPVDMRKAR